MPDIDPGYRTYPADRTGEFGAVIRRKGDEIEMVNLRWGLRPKERDQPPFTVVRSEGREFPSNRCLIPGSEFFYKRGAKRYRFTLASGDHFYFAGIWRPATGEWPASYAILTIEPNADVAPYHHRQMAVLRRGEHMAWLDHTKPESEILRPLPAFTFRVKRDGAEVQQPELVF